ncbi:acetyl-CoA carboxylase biotin carboxylase subunit family protein [Myroides odoratimimus]|uniref:ATP-grasp domain-containing protein n=1 Tax=Myroides odoratimimus TaxID=76832 RepID=UPI00370B8A64
MKKVLILGTNAGQADIIEYFKELGWYVYSCGFKKTGPGVELSDEFYLVDTTNIEDLVQLAKKLKVDVVYSVSSDTNITSATKVSEILGLPILVNSELINLFNKKDEFRCFLNSNEISTVDFITIDNINEDNAKGLLWSVFPCVVKPVDSQGQRGVQLVYKQEDLYSAVKEASKWALDGKVIIEEFLDGAEISTNIIVQNGKILINEFSDRIVFENDFFGLPKGHGVPVSYINKEQLELAQSYVVKIVEKLNIIDAVLYIQMKLKDGIPKIIEIAPRLDGCHIWRLLKAYKGFDLRLLAVKCLLGEPITESDLGNNYNKPAVLEFYHLPANTKFDKTGFDVNDDVLYNEFRYHQGEEIVSINGRLEVVGYCVYTK